MDSLKLLYGLFLFIGGLAVMVLGILYLGSLKTCSSTCGSPYITYVFFVAGITLIIIGAFFLAKARFASLKSPYPRQYSRV